MELIQLLENANQLKKQLDAFRPLDKDMERRIMQKIRLDWNFHSNHLEGNPLTFGETKALILFGMTAKGKPLQEHLEMSGHDEAVKIIEEVVKDEMPLSEHFIRELHEIILVKGTKKKAITPDGRVIERRIKIGQYKTSPNHVETQTGEMFYFATPEETPAKMKDLIDWYREQKARADIHPIVLASEFHYKFVRIHPFDDGNGRLSRLLMNGILMQYGYPPAIIRTEDKENYYIALRQADAEMLEEFVSYITKNVIHTLNLMLKGARGESIEDLDDIDKEIALLEQKINHTGDKIEKLRSKEVLLEFGEKELPKIVACFMEQNEKLSSFYMKTEFSFATFPQELNPISFSKENHKTVSQKIMQTFADNLALNPSQGITISCNFNSFNKDGITAFNYIELLHITFEETHFIIHTSPILNPKNTNIHSCLYHKKMPIDLVKEIIQGEMKKHIEYIKEQADKKEQ